jgi:hypothetical protein
MKPSLREDLTAIAAIGVGAFMSGVVTAITIGVTASRDYANSFSVEVLDEPHVDVRWEVRMSGPEGPHSGWFPENEVRHRPDGPGHIRLESSHSRIIVHRHK